MAASTIVITYSGTNESDAIATSFTMGGVAFDSITSDQLRLAQKLLRQASNLITTTKAHKIHKGS